MNTLISNVRLVSPGLDLPGASIEIFDKTIARIYRAGEKLPEATKVVDGAGRIAMPGFIDIHTHGAAGHDVADANLEGLRAMAKAKLHEGVTSFLPTTLTLGQDRLVEMAKNCAAYMAKPDFAKAPGMHVEGPFINPKCTGAQNPAFVRDPNIAELRQLNAIAPAAVISIAPEMPGAVDFIREATALGVRVSCAHTSATHAQFKAAKAAGLAHLTHFCNQMSALHHREIGIVGSGLIDDDIRIELICDKLHLCPDMLKLVFKLKPIEQLMLITDSMSASWQPDGRYELGSLPVFVKNGEARLENGALAGSTLKYFVGVRNIHEVTGIPLQELVKATSWNQARSLGLKGLGKLEAGYTADIVLMDAEFTPVHVWVDGVCKF